MAYRIDLAFKPGEPVFEFEDKPENMRQFGLSLGLPIGLSRLPTRARETIGRKNLPDIFSLPGLNAVSERFRQLVEDFEPGIHQFFPLELFYKNGHAIKKDYFILNCTVALDSIIVDRSEVYWLKLDTPNEYPRLRIGWRDKLVLSRPAIVDHHLWCGLRIQHSGIIISNEFYNKMKSMKLKYFESYYVEESPEAWVASENIAPLLKKEARDGLERGMLPWLNLNPERLR